MNLIKMVKSILILVILSGTRSSASLQIEASSVIQTGMVSTTNLIVTKIATNGVRMDIDSNLSVIILPREGGQVQLFHQNKTYHWISVKGVASNSNQAPLLPVAIQTTFDGYPAQLFCLTNGLERNRIWVAPNTQFLESATNIYSREKPVVNLFEKQTAGAAFDDHSLIVGTEYSVIGPVAVPPTSSQQPGFTNVLFLQSTKLVSIAETNFAASEFEVPDDYKDGAGLLDPSYQVDPAKMSHTPVGAGNFEGLRQGYENGKPVLAPIPYH